MTREMHNNVEDHGASASLNQRPTEAKMRRVMTAQENALAKGSKDLYRKHWEAFVDWSSKNHYAWLPAHPDTISAYLTERADNKTKVPTLRTILAAIRHYHEAKRYTSPTTNPDVKLTLKGLSREYPHAPRQVAALNQEAFDAIFEAALQPKEHETAEQASKRAVYDLALISFSRDVLARPSEAAAAEWQHVEEMPDGRYVLFIPRSKTDQAGEGDYAFLTQLTMRLLGQLFRMRKPAPKATDHIFPISERQISNRIQAAAEHAKLEGRYRGQSARVGMATDLAIDDVEMPALQQVGRWSSESSPTRYTRKIKATKNAVAKREGTRKGQPRVSDE